MRVLVTGGTGYLGRAIGRALISRGHSLVVFSTSAAESALPGRLVGGDVRDPAALAAATDDCDAICHTAALVSIWRRRRQDFDDVNIGGLRNVLTVARNLGIARVIYTSSFLALRPADAASEQRANDYQRTKVEANHLAQTEIAGGARLICMYPGVVYGPGARREGNFVGGLIADHLKGRLPGLIGADRRWSYAFVDDVADAHVTALERGRIGGQYYLGGETTTLMHVFEIVRTLTGRPLPRRIPYSVAKAIGVLEEWRAAVGLGTPRLTRGAVEIFSHDWILDSDEAIRELGYRVTPLTEGITRTVESLSSSIRSR